MPTFLGIVLLVILVAIAEQIPGHAWIGVGIVVGTISLFVAGWFLLAFLVRAFLKIALGYKD